MLVVWRGLRQVPVSLTGEKSPPPAVAPLPFPLLLGLFAASGATGLVDQLCFSKYLATVVGATAHAVSAVLAAFMAGLAIGAFLGGRISGRVQRPLIAYGVLELVVSAAVVGTPLGFALLTPAYAALARVLQDSLAWLSAIRWLTAFVLVAIPTAAMGATLPLLSRRVEQDSLEQGRKGRRLTALYAANTLGGAGGALLAAYVALPLWGLKGTLWTSAGLSALVGVASLIAGRKETRHAETTPTVTGLPPPPISHFAPSGQERGLLLGFAFLSGALVFASEVLFTHLLALIIGNSAYAFGLILAAFLVSLFTGATLASRVRSWLSDGALPLSLAATGLSLALTLPVWDELPRLFALTGRVTTSFEGREAVRGLVALSILFVPASLMGLTFPLLLERAARATPIGLWVGRLTATNTIGAVSGSLGTGYAVLPALGSERTLIAISACFAGSALLAAQWATRPKRRASWVVVLACAVVALCTPRWNLATLTSGANVYFESPDASARLVSIREDVHGGVTTVTEANGVYTLYTNGKFQGNTGWEMHAQRLFAHYPSIFVEHFGQALVIGLGTGTTLGTLLAYPWKRIDVAEISPSIVDAASRYFRVPNRDAMADPRVRLSVADGRNTLLVRAERYDLISMELSSIWFAGAASLYSDEFYQLLRARLSPRGVLQQWVQLHHIRRRDFATVIYTLRKNFRDVALFYGGGQGILVASPDRLQIADHRLEFLEKIPEVRETEPFHRSLRTLTDDILVLGDGLDEFLQSIASELGEPVSSLVSTDDNLYLEYATPHGNVLPWSARDQLVQELSQFRDPRAIEALHGP